MTPRVRARTEAERARDAMDRVDAWLDRAEAAIDRLDRPCPATPSESARDRSHRR